MIKSYMEFIDILFPLNLGPLTYRCPEEFSGVVMPGMIVSAPIKNKLVKGIVLGKAFKIPSGEIKDIHKVYGEAPILSSCMVNLLKWMSGYYLTEQGIVLKNMLPREAFTKVKQRKKRVRGPACRPSGRDKEGSEGGWRDYQLHIININDKTVASFIDSITQNIYRTFLLHAPSSTYEYLFLIEMLTKTKNAILLIPELSLVNNFYPNLSERFRERVCLLHSGLSRGKRSESIERILSGDSDIVLGTRSAVFAPLKKVNFIAVLHEHSSSYKQEDGPRYHGRDIAVMRGYIEKATVLLSSICPSLESIYNCRKGKYTLIKPEGDFEKPKVRIIDMKHEKLLKPPLSKKVIDASMRYIKNNKKVMFVINRRGYSTLVQCTECNYIEECPSCRVPLVFHKQVMLLKCHYCGHMCKVPESCRRCRSYNIEFLGAGTQKIQEDIEKLLGIKTLRLDSDISRKKSEIEELIGATYRDDVKIIIGTKLMTRRVVVNGGFSMAAILNTDLFLNQPDFRSTEKTYQEISFITEKIAPTGEIFIQTRMPQNYLFKSLKNYDYATFFREELIRRKSIRYPPYSRLLLIRFISKNDLSKKLSEVVEKKGKDVEILGPSISKNSKGEYEFKLLLKSSVRGALHAVTKTIMEVFKDSKDIKIKVDVDPMSI